MRIIINIDEGRDAKNRRAVRVRTGYYSNAADNVRLHNCGVEIYNCIKEAFGRGFEGGVVIHEGERK